MRTGFFNISTNAKVRIAQSISTSLRGILRLAGRGPVLKTRRGGINWRLDLREGIDLALFLGVYEPHVARALPRLVTAGAVIIDIGANIGAQTLPLAHLAGVTGRVVAVEPTCYAYGKLQDNLALNPDLTRRVTTVQAMLGKDGGTLTKRVPSSWPLTGDRSGIDVEFAGKPRSTWGARLLSLDALVEDLDLDRIDLIKIDVDGHESDVLAGANRTIARFSPRILMEIAPYLHDRRPGGFDNLMEQIRRLGYRAQALEDGKGIPLNRNAFGYSIAASCDVLLIHSALFRKAP